MTMRRLLQDNPTESERRLLRSMRLDRPPPSSKHRVLGAVGALAATTTAASSGVAAVSAVGVAKVLTLVVLGGVATAGVVREVSARNERPLAHVSAPAEIAHRTASEPGTEPAGVLAAEEGPTAASDVASPLPGELRTLETERAPVKPERTGSQRQPRPPTPLVSGSATASPAPATSTIADEISALEASRRALAAGDAASSLEQLDAFERRFSQPALGPEATLLRIQTLLALSRDEEARALGDRFLRQHPDSAYSQRVRSLLGNGLPKNP